MPNSAALFNLKYSQNLGDGVIALCLEDELRRHFASWNFRSIDLAGRTEWSAPAGGAKRATSLWLLDRLPSRARDVAVQTVLGVELRRRLLRFYSEGVRDCQFAIFGGGQLFQDGDLNFPLKLAAAAEACSAARVPFGIYGVGATASRSSTGRRLFNRVLTTCQPNVVFARDEASAARLKELGSPFPKSCLDPGVLASDLWPALAALRGHQGTIGLCITHPAVLRHHGGALRGSAQAVIDRTVALIERLVAEKYTVTCFTNGAGEDELFLAQCSGRLGQAGMIGDRVIISPRCANPAELARLIASFDLVIAHRLHACILAYSYRVPAIGLRWDAKLEAFFAAVGQHDAVLDLERTSNDEIASRVAAAISNPISMASHRASLELARSGVREMADGLRKIMRPPGAGRTVGNEAAGQGERAMA